MECFIPVQKKKKRTAYLIRSYIHLKGKSGWVHDVCNVLRPFIQGKYGTIHNDIVAAKFIGSTMNAKEILPTEQYVN